MEENKNTNEIGVKGVNADLCKFKHDRVDKDIYDIKEELRQLEEDIIGGIEQNKEKCQIINDNRYTNLKDKVICTVKSINNKIDSLSNKYEALKNRIDGNGNIGVFEEIRGIKSSIKWLWIFLVIFIILGLGGSYSGISIETLREKIFGKEEQNIKKEYESPKVPSIEIDIIENIH